MSPATARADAAAPTDRVATGMFDFLDNSHRELQQRLADLTGLLDEIERDGLSAAVRERARRAHAWFETDARQHHLDEEQHVFPALLASSDVGLVEQTQRLRQDHGWIEENWLEIAPSLAAAADGHPWFDPMVLRQQLGVFTQLYLDHLALEETLAYPQARALINPREREVATAEMAKRRAQRVARMESKLPRKGG